MNTNMHQLKSLCFVFNPDDDSVLVQQIGAGKYARMHTGVETVCGTDNSVSGACLDGIGNNSGLEVANLKNRGFVKLVCEDEAPQLFVVYEATYVHGEIVQNAEGRLKWVEVLNIFNLKFQPWVQEILGHLLDGETFFEAFFREDASGNLTEQEVYLNIE